MMEATSGNVGEEPKITWFREDGYRDAGMIVAIGVVGWLLTTLLSSSGMFVPRLDPLQLAVATAILILFVLHLTAKAVVLEVGLSHDRVTMRHLLKEQVIESKDVASAMLDPPRSELSAKRQSTGRVLRIRYLDSRRKPTLIFDFSDGLKLRMARVLDPTANPGNPFELF